MDCYIIDEDGNAVMNPICLDCEESYIDDIYHELCCKMKSCWYKAVVGTDPKAEDCKRLHPNGCDDCSYFLPDPPKPDWDGDQDQMPW